MLMTQSSGSFTRNNFISIQYLRGLASIAVIYEHAMSIGQIKNFEHYSFELWGVDIFFVISGFAMWISTEGNRSSPKEFLAKRFFRVYSLYWIALTIWILSRLIYVDTHKDYDITLDMVISSFFDTKHNRWILSEIIFPILIPGWTLQFELFFYCIICFSLFFKIDFLRLRFISTILIVLFVTGIIYHVDSPIYVLYTSPLLLEFLFGIWIAFCYKRIQKIFWPYIFVVAILSFILLISEERDGNPDFLRFVACGIPSILITATLVFLEPFFLKHPIKLLIKLGDASFSMYLFHPFVIRVVYLLKTSIFSDINSFYLETIFILCAIVASVTSALFVTKFIEIPVLRGRRYIGQAIRDTLLGK